MPPTKFQPHSQLMCQIYEQNVKLIFDKDFYPNGLISL